MSRLRAKVSVTFIYPILRVQDLRIPYDQELNPQQQQAVFSVAGPHLVIAGAGSGKTRVLVYRTAYLVEQGVAPERLLLLTFTRRAAREMLDRAAIILDERCRRVSGGTFHSFAHQVLRRYSERLGISCRFSILDQSDAENCLQLIRTHMGLHKRSQRFPRKQSLLAMLSAVINRAEDLESVILRDHPHFYEWIAEIRRIGESYRVFKRERNLLDFDDLLICLRDLLAQHEDVRAGLSDYYQYIMVDEYQDTNALQAEITVLLGQGHGNVMVVGDDAQSIYSFRGANFRNIIRFPQLFPGTKFITLEQNYRSTQPILNLSNAVIRQAPERYEKDLFTQRPGERLPVYLEVTTENRQSRYIVGAMESLRAQGVGWGEMAVLFRAGWHSNDLEVELSANGIPFVKYGGQKFVESAHVKDVISLLQMARHPDHEPAMIRGLRLLRGVGEQTAVRLAREISRNYQDFRVPEKLTRKKPGLQRMMEFFQNLVQEEEAPVETLEKILGFYIPLMPDLYDDFDRRMYDLESLRTMAERYQELETFLADLALEPPEQSLMDLRAVEPAQEHVTLSTIHSAKGLEWHTVFVLFLAEGYLPSYRAEDNPDAVEEERRLFYVAATRAKENLFLLRPQVESSGRFSSERRAFRYTRPSRFLLEGGIIYNHVDVESDDSQYSPSWDMI